ncbi:GntR family transcriptional regulator [Catenuloplanes indicus]|uniref:DNA-binding GntR family transcriptional regulator n=1 Tax=Catenuloplanes indicus TaxID=137267 RepID=A0AAE4B4N0_9ACTN|nr:UTRA domain-containing protein [Catenuloplanes indicus]MDQ0363336.1 DNA-binding GntR family transcriptional regulator [Catenuloplanes indicus]MDQ0371658.1 DNA-binding GntR family transcriptional regulator [Catenuloplanes indicus]
MTSEKWTSDSTIYLTPGQGDAWAKQAQATSRTGTQRILHAGPVPARADVAAALGVEPGTSVVLRRRLILADERPVEIADSYYPTAIADGTALATPGKIPGGAVTLLDQLGYHAAEIHEDVTARHPTAEETAILHLTPTAPVLVLTRLSLTADGTPFEYAAMTMSDGQHLRYQMQAA